jgi:hypothetical protein
MLFVGRKEYRYYRYGTLDVLRMEDVEKPIPGEDEVQVKIRAASLNCYWYEGLSVGRAGQHGVRAYAAEDGARRAARDGRGCPANRRGREDRPTRGDSALRCPAAGILAWLKDKDLI